MGAIKKTLVMSLLISGPILAQFPVPIGEEFQVNTYTTNSQKQAAVAAAPEGGFVVVWTSDGADGDVDGIRGQRFTPSGAPSGAEFQINSYTTSIQRWPDVALDAVGNFVVVWNSFQYGFGYSVHGQRFDAGGVELGEEFGVDSSNPQTLPAVAVAPDGAFVVVWQSSESNSSNSSINGQRFDADGSPQGVELQVNSYNTGRQQLPAVAMHPAGDFVVVWHSCCPDGSGYSVQGQRFDATGDRLAGEFRVNSYTTGGQVSPAVAASEGGFVVAWRSNLGDGTDYGIRGQGFDADGIPLGSELQINTYTTGRQNTPAVAMASDGKFVVVWESAGSYGTDTGSRSIQAQLYDASGSPQGGEFQVNTYTEDNQSWADVAMDADGDFVTVWHSWFQDGSFYGVHGQSWALAYFADGFESGDTSAWSRTVP